MHLIVGLRRQGEGQARGEEEGRGSARDRVLSTVLYYQIEIVYITTHPPESRPFFESTDPHLNNTNKISRGDHPGG